MGDVYQEFIFCYIALHFCFSNIIALCTALYMGCDGGVKVCSHLTRFCLTLCKWAEWVSTQLARLLVRLWTH